ncbi:hypothetical protein [Microbacterium elymi]|uniref:Uncharacterized protein n=1 Tax=Microbacterium elymi TaxID=2909587 RepID=A0ABY5NKJ1_9MICO|nr:hypothetical protein [Microbacterium elymi]UUT35698.1 hypothetical protein L2X98_20905 [Microbacterium elymi]
MIPALGAPVDDANEDARAIVGIVIELVPVVLAVVAVVQVWRAGVVPRAFGWIPAIALALCVVPALVQYAVFATPAFATGDAILAYGSVLILCRTVALVGLGVVAIVAGLQARAAASGVPVYPPADA